MRVPGMGRAERRHWDHRRKEDVHNGGLETVGGERAQEFGIIRWASAVASVMVNDATNGGAPLADADKSPTIARDGYSNGIGNGGAGTLARDGGALGQRKKAGPITQRKDGIETRSKDEEEGER